MNQRLSSAAHVDNDPGLRMPGDLPSAGVSSTEANFALALTAARQDIRMMISSLGSSGLLPSSPISSMNSRTNFSRLHPEKLPEERL